MCQNSCIIFFFSRKQFYFPSNHENSKKKFFLADIFSTLREQSICTFVNMPHDTSIRMVLANNSWQFPVESVLLKQFTTFRTKQFFLFVTGRKNSNLRQRHEVTQTEYLLYNRMQRAVWFTETFEVLGSGIFQHTIHGELEFLRYSRMTSVENWGFETV